MARARNLGRDGNVGALARFRLLQKFWKAAGGASAHRHISLVRSTCRGYQEFFRAAAVEPLCEGIVLKRAESRVIGSKDGCADNPQWLKVKHPRRTKSVDVKNASAVRQ